jgi:hypothetical protein
MPSSVALPPVERCDAWDLPQPLARGVGGCDLLYFCVQILDLLFQSLPLGP